MAACSRNFSRCIIMSEIATKALAWDWRLPRGWRGSLAAILQSIAPWAAAVDSQSAFPTSSPAGNAHAANSTAVSKPRVLLVEDDLASANALGILLRHRGYE